MKRALVVLLALVMGAGLVFAADQAPAKWGAYVEGWLTLYDQDGQAFLSPSWDGDNSLGQYTTLSLSYAEANMGFSFTGEFDSDNIFGGNDPAVDANQLRNMSGWYKVFDGLLKFTAGKDRVADYRPGTYVEGAAAYTRIANAEWGLLTQVYPVEGLSVGAFVKFPEGPAVQDYVNNLGFGISYELANIGTFYAQYRTINDNFGFAAKIGALKALPLFLAYGFTQGAPDPTHVFLFSAQYVMDAFTFAADVKFQYIADADFAVEVLAKYALNESWTAGINAGYATMSYFTDGGPGILVYPWMQLAVGSASSLKFGFRLDTEYDTEGLQWNIPLKYVISF